MVGGIFGKGGGKELQFSQLADALEARFGKRDGRDGVPGLPRRRGPRGAGDRLRAALPVPGAAASSPRASRAPTAGTLKLNATGTTGVVLPRHAGARLQRRCSSAARSRERPPADGRRAAGRLLQPADPDGAGRARARDRGRPGHRRPGRLVRRHQPLRPARPRARLRVERDLRRPGHHRHLRARALRRHPLPLPRALRADRGAREDQPLGADARPTRPSPARRRCAPSARSSGSSPGAARSAASR